METEAALGGVRINGEHMPRDGVCPGWQSPNTDAHYVAADALPLSTRAPEALRTSAPLNFGSSACVK